MTSTISDGELFLVGAAAKHTAYRLRWDPGSDTSKRAIPAGTYRVLGYRHVRAAADGSTWIWSTTSPGFRELKVVAGESIHCAVERTPRVRTRAFVHEGKQRVELVFQAEERLGHTLYQDGRRITIRWQCLDGDGAVLEEGPMGYG